MTVPSNEQCIIKTRSTIPDSEVWYKDVLCLQTTAGPAHLDDDSITQAGMIFRSLPVMALDEAGMHRLGLAFIYRMVPVIVVSILYGT